LTPAVAENLPRREGHFSDQRDYLLDCTLFTNVWVDALVPFFGWALEKGDYQTSFITILAEGFSKIV